MLKTKNNKTVTQYDVEYKASEEKSKDAELNLKSVIYRPQENKKSTSCLERCSLKTRGSSVSSFRKLIWCLIIL